ncbi:MAG TPA: hypothetical protein VFY67_06230 [Pyrinomonadaceae bacterium]|nr:hypothetical protein [Pyrinomonadaceae bacterium]
MSVKKAQALRNGWAWAKTIRSIQGKSVCVLLPGKKLKLFRPKLSLLCSTVKEGMLAVLAVCWRFLLRAAKLKSVWQRDWSFPEFYLLFGIASESREDRGANQKWHK